MARKRIKVLLVLAAAVLCTGCWDAKDINMKDYTTVASIDYKNGEYYFYTEIAVLTRQNAQADKKNAQKNQNMSKVIISTGKTFGEARANLEAKLDRPLFLDTSKVIILGPGMTRQGVDEFLFRLRENVDHRKTAFVITTREDLSALLNTDTENEALSGNGIEQTLEHVIDQGASFRIVLSDILEYISGRNNCYILPNFDIAEKDLALTGYSAMFGDKLAGFVPFEESRGMVYFLNDHAKWSYTVPYGQNTAAVSVELGGRQITPHYSGEKVSFAVAFSFHATVKYLTQNWGFDARAREEVRKSLQKQLLDDICLAIQQAQGVCKCDYLEFDEAFRIAYPQVYKKMDWNDAFLKSEFDVSVKTDLNAGNMNYDRPNNQRGGG